MGKFDHVLKDKDYIALSDEEKIAVWDGLFNKHVTQDQDYQKLSESERQATYQGFMNKYYGSEKRQAVLHPKAQPAEPPKTDKYGITQPKGLATMDVTDVEWQSQENKQRLSDVWKHYDKEISKSQKEADPSDIAWEHEKVDQAERIDTLRKQYKVINKHQAKLAELENKTKTYAAELGELEIKPNPTAKELERIKYLEDIVDFNTNTMYPLIATGMKADEREAFKQGREAANTPAKSMVQAFALGSVDLNPYNNLSPDGKINRRSKAYMAGMQSGEGDFVSDLVRGTFYSIPMSLSVMINPIIGTALTTTQITADNITKYYDDGVLTQREAAAAAVSGAIQGFVEYGMTDIQMNSIRRAYVKGGMNAAKDQAARGITNLITPSLKTMPKALLTAGLQEGTEEVVQLTADVLTRHAINGDPLPNPVDFAKEATLNFVGGAVGGVILGGAGTTFQTAISKNNLKTLTEWQKGGSKTADSLLKSLNYYNQQDWDNAAKELQIAKKEAINEKLTKDQTVQQVMALAHDAQSMHETAEHIIKEQELLSLRSDINKAKRAAETATGDELESLTRDIAQYEKQADKLHSELLLDKLGRERHAAFLDMMKDEKKRSEIDSMLPDSPGQFDTKERLLNQSAADLENSTQRFIEADAQYNEIDSEYQERFPVVEEEVKPPATQEVKAEIEESQTQEEMERKLLPMDNVDATQNNVAQKDGTNDNTDTMGIPGSDEGRDKSAIISSTYEGRSGEETETNTGETEENASGENRGLSESNTENEEKEQRPKRIYVIKIRKNNAPLFYVAESIDDKYIYLSDGTKVKKGVSPVSELPYDAWAERKKKSDSRSSGSKKAHKTRLVGKTIIDISELQKMPHLQMLFGKTFNRGDAPSGMEDVLIRMGKGQYNLKPLINITDNHEGEDWDTLHENAPNGLSPDVAQAQAKADSSYIIHAAEREFDYYYNNKEAVDSAQALDDILEQRENEAYEAEQDYFRELIDALDRRMKILTEQLEIASSTNDSKLQDQIIEEMMDIEAKTNEIYSNNPALRPEGHQESKPENGGNIPFRMKPLTPRERARKLAKEQITAAQAIKSLKDMLKRAKLLESYEETKDGAIFTLTDGSKVTIKNNKDMIVVPEGGTAIGRMVPSRDANGNFNALIDLVTSFNQGNLTLYHEYFHMAYLILLNGEQKAWLNRYYSKQSGIPLSSAVELEEYIADKFMEYGRAYDKQSKNMVSKIWNRMIERLHSIMKALGLAGKDAGDLFRDIVEGKAVELNSTDAGDTAMSRSLGRELNIDPIKFIDMQLSNGEKYRDGYVVVHAQGIDVRIPVGASWNDKDGNETGFGMSHASKHIGLTGKDIIKTLKHGIKNTRSRDINYILKLDDDNTMKIGVAKGWDNDPDVYVMKTAFIYDKDGVARTTAVTTIEGHQPAIRSFQSNRPNGQEKGTADKSQDKSPTPKPGTRNRILGLMGVTNLHKGRRLNLLLENLDRAVEMFDAGKNNTQTRLATGWEIGLDGKWRYEIPNRVKVRLGGTGFIDSINGVEQSSGSYTKKEIKSIIPHALESATLPQIVKSTLNDDLIDFIFDKIKKGKSITKINDYELTMFFKRGGRNFSSTEIRELLTWGKANLDHASKQKIKRTQDHLRLTESPGHEYGSKFPYTTEPVETYWHASLPDIYEDADLYKAYPSMKNIKVIFHPMSVGGYYSESKNTIAIHVPNDRTPYNYYKPTTLWKLKSTFAHEVQHVIQHMERFTQGASVDHAEKQYYGVNLTPIEKYYRIIGEVEARNASYRDEKDRAWLKRHPLETTEDIDRNKQFPENRILPIYMENQGRSFDPLEITITPGGKLSFPNFIDSFALKYLQFLPAETQHAILNITSASQTDVRAHAKEIGEHIEAISGWLVYRGMLSYLVFGRIDVFLNNYYQEAVDETKQQWRYDSAPKELQKIYDRAFELLPDHLRSMKFKIPGRNDLLVDNGIRNRKLSPEESQMEEVRDRYRGENVLPTREEIDAADKYWQDKIDEAEDTDSPIPDEWYDNRDAPSKKFLRILEDRIKSVVGASALGNVRSALGLGYTKLDELEVSISWGWMNSLISKIESKDKNLQQSLRDAIGREIVAKIYGSKAVYEEIMGMSSALTDTGKEKLKLQINDTASIVISIIREMAIEATKPDTYLKAPNGKPTKLNERQWLQVRTKAFKDWFGDWENDPTNASKVVDENGEPMVVYHGTINGEFYVFDTPAYFSSSPGESALYTVEFSAYHSWENFKRKGSSVKDDSVVIEELDSASSFVDLMDASHPGIEAMVWYVINDGVFRRTKDRKIDRLDGVAVEFDYDAINWKRADIPKKAMPYIGIYFLNIRNPETMEIYEGNKLAGKGNQRGIVNNSLVEKLKSKGMDGVFAESDWTIAANFVAFSPTQIKSATANIGTFDSENPDIRYRKAQEQIRQTDANNAGDSPTYKILKGYKPTKTIKAYKIFKEINGNLYPMFVDSKADPIPYDAWIEANDAYSFAAKNGLRYVPAATGVNIPIHSKELAQELLDRGLIKTINTKGITSVSYRPGWHASQLPFAPQMGPQPEGVFTAKHPYKNVYPHNAVFVEVEIDMSKDYGAEQGSNGLQYLPKGGGYKFTTSTENKKKFDDINPWYISGAMKIVKKLSREEVNSMLITNGIKPKQWQDSPQLKGKRKANSQGEGVTANVGTFDAENTDIRFRNLTDAEIIALEEETARIKKTQRGTDTKTLTKEVADQYGLDPAQVEDKVGRQIRAGFREFDDELQEISAAVSLANVGKYIQTNKPEGTDKSDLVFHWDESDESAFTQELGITAEQAMEMGEDRFSYYLGAKKLFAKGNAAMAELSVLWEQMRENRDKGIEDKALQERFDIVSGMASQIRLHYDNIKGQAGRILSEARRQKTQSIAGYETLLNKMQEDETKLYKEISELRAEIETLETLIAETEKIYNDLLAEVDGVIEMAKKQNAKIKAMNTGARFKASDASAMKAELSLRLEEMRRKTELKKAQMQKAIDDLKAVRAEQEALAPILDFIKPTGGKKPPKKPRITDYPKKALTFVDWMKAVYYNSMLASPITHGVNIVSTATNGLLEDIINIVLDPIGGLNGITAKLSGYGDAAMNVKKSYKDSSDYSEKWHITQTENKIMKYLNLNLRTLAAEDAFFNTFASKAQIQSIAISESKRTGIPVNSLLQNPSTDMIRQMQYEAARACFNQNPEGIIGMIVNGFDNFARTMQQSDSLTTQVIGTLWQLNIMPFTRVVGNVANAWIDYTPLGLIRSFEYASKNPESYLSKQRGIWKDENGDAITSPFQNRDVTRQIARAAIGSILAILIYLLLKGRISGDGPEDQAMKRQLMESGWRPNSLKIGDIWYPVSEMPIGGIFSAIGNIHEYEMYGSRGKRPEDFVAMATNALFGIGKSFLDKHFLSSLQGMITAFSRGDDKWLMRQIAGTATTPLSPNLFRFAHTLINRDVHRPETTWQYMINNTRWIHPLNQYVPNSVDVFGRTVKRDHAFARLTGIRDQQNRPLMITAEGDTQNLRAVVNILNENRIKIPSTNAYELKIADGEYITLRGFDKETMLRARGAHISMFIMDNQEEIMELLRDGNIDDTELLMRQIATASTKEAKEEMIVAYDANRLKHKYQKYSKSKNKGDE